MTRSGCMSQIQTLIEGISTLSPAIVAVTQGPAMSIPTTPWATYEISAVNNLEEFASLTDESSESLILVKVFNRAPLAPQEGDTVAIQQWECMAALRTALKGDSTLGGNCDNLFINTASTGVEEINGAFYYVITAQLTIQILSDTAVSA